MAALSAAERHEARIASCIHCGYCLESCPTYVETGHEEESPRGRLLLAHGLTTGRWEARAVLGPLDRCLGCRACETACPSGVPYGRILEEVRASLESQRDRPRNGWERLLVRHLLTHPSRLRLLVGGYRLFRLWRLAHGLARWRALPAKHRFRLRLAPRPETPAPRGPLHSEGRPVVLLRGCVARALFPESESAMIRLLAAAGYSVSLADRPACCGALAHHLGDRAQSRRSARELVSRIPGEGVILATAAGCGAHLKSLHHLFEGDPLETHARGAAARVQDLTEALLQGPRRPAFQSAPRAVAYQDACHLRHAQGITDEPRELLRATGAEIREVEEGELCCGSAGTYNLVEDEMAARLGERKAEVLRRSGADVVVTANPGCAIQLRAHLHRADDPEVVSLPVYLASHL